MNRILEGNLTHIPISRRAFGRSVAGLGLLSTMPDALRAETAGPRRGGTVTYLLEPEPTTLVAFNTTGGPTVATSPKVTEGLLTYDFDLTPRPELAVAWGVSEDGLEYTFKLRPGVKWHDGQDFTSADVAFSIQLLKDAHPRGRNTFANVAAVRTPDPLTAVIVLSKPAPFLISALAAGESPIVPRHVYEKGPADANPNNNAPIGTGPFLFKEWVKGSHIIYARNPNYWDPPKPYIDELIVRFIPDAGARVAALETAAVDLAVEIPLSEIARLKALPHLDAEIRGFEYSPGTTRIEFNLDNQYLRNAPVRQAIAHSIDRAAILDAAWYGYGVVAPSPVSPLLPRFYDANVETYPHDPATAEKLLDQAGFPRGANGVRFTLTHDYFPYGDGYKRVADYLRPALAKIGIGVTIRSQDFAAWLKRVYTDKDFDFMNHVMTSTFDPNVGLQRYFSSQGYRKGVPFTNAAHYANPEVDRLLEAASVETDPVQRKRYLDQFQETVARDLPGVNLVSVQQTTLYNRRVVNHTTGATGLSSNFADVYVTS
jgi:peptide/nickel transport system substrate-binding protein